MSDFAAAFLKKTVKLVSTFSLFFTMKLQEHVDIAKVVAIFLIPCLQILFETF